MTETYYSNFQAALHKLEQFCQSFDGSEVERAGIIQAFEQAWKALQKKAGSEGVSTIASPKKAFEWALSAGLISAENEALWLEILSDPNLTSHTYRQAMAEQVSNNVMQHYLKEFKNLLHKIQAS